MGIFLPIKCKEHAHCMCANEKIKCLFNNLSLLLCAIFYITALNFATQHISVFAEFTQENEKPSIVFTWEIFVMYHCESQAKQKNVNNCGKWFQFSHRYNLFSALPDNHPSVLGHHRICLTQFYFLKIQQYSNSELIIYRCLKGQCHKIFDLCFVHDSSPKHI